MSDVPTVSQLIDQLGDGTKVAHALNAILPADAKHVDRNAVYKWKQADRIPVGRRLYVARLAIARNLPLPQQLTEYGELLKAASPEGRA